MAGSFTRFVPGTQLPEWIEPVYEVSFPSAERYPFADYMESLVDPSTVDGYDIRLYFSDVSFAFIEVVSDQILLLSYLATKPGCRGGGLGANFLTQVRQSLSAEFPGVPLFFEVEYPQTAQDFEIAERRLAWYQRLGAYTGIKVVAPAYDHESGEWTTDELEQFILMAFGVEDGCDWRAAYDEVLRQSYDLSDDLVRALHG